MKKTRRKFTSAFKTKVVFEALSNKRSLQELAEKFAVHPNQIASWKKEFVENAQKVFEGDSNKNKELEQERDDLFKHIGQLQVENNWLKKKLL